ncbi:MAG: acetyl-CoA C-acyltransferase [Chloroflexota bacterium]|nr:acetyl-CoA C-acyltransferase [Chloroflexota bacterium]
MTQHEVVILSGARTPIGRFLGGLASLTAAQLGQIAVREAVARAGIDAEDVSEVILGNVVSAGVGQALPRQVSIGAGIPSSVGGLSVNKVCGSGLKAVMIAANAIKADDGVIYIAGGTESMSNAPFLLRDHRTGFKYGKTELIDALQNDGLWCSLCDWGMGNAAEFVARELNVTRAELDDYAFTSHMRAHFATTQGHFADEIVPVCINGKHEDTIIDRDESIRPSTTVEALAKLKPAFEQDGVVTAGNAPGMNDGAAAVVVASRAYAESKGITPLARIVAYGQAAVDPAWLFYAPVKAIPIALARAGWTMADVDLVELNEAFAAQVVADVKGLAKDGFKLPYEKLNVNGGAIALGHPIGASGTRVLITLIHALKQRGLKRGIASLCLGGSEAVAMAVELI